MKILVTGANGMLGQDLCPILEDNGYDVVETDINNLDITDFSSCKSFIKKELPEIIIHCAAYTNVDNAENEKDLATKINEKGTENLAKICSELNIVLVYISTDYVFDGERSKPYLPMDKTNPINTYGLSKLKGEQAVLKYCSEYYVIRTSWLYGHHGKNFVETMLSMKDKSDLKVVNDQIGCPTWTVDLANGIIEILDEEYGIYHVCGGGSATWYDFAKEIFELSNLSTKIIPCATEDYPQLANRPKYSVMDNNGICRHWKQALKDYLDLRFDE